MFHDLVSMAFMLAQNSQEKSATIIGLTLFAGFMFFLFVDTLIKGKFVPKKGPVKKFVLFLSIMAFIIVIMLFIFYK